MFDCDGLLVDTAGCWRAAYHAAAARADTVLDGFDLGALDGASTHGAAEQLSDALGVPISPRAIAEGLTQALTNREVVAMPGAERLLGALAAASLPIAVASNAPAPTVRLALKRAGLRAGTARIISAEAAGIFKPDPDCTAARAGTSMSIPPMPSLSRTPRPVHAPPARRE